MELKRLVIEADKPPPPKKTASLALPIFLFCCAGVVVAALLFVVNPRVNTPAATSSLEVTPLDTSPDMLNVTVMIWEDQDTTDNTSDITISFSTTAIKEHNYVRFDQPNDAIMCNGVKQPLGGSMQYTLHISRKSYTCLYSGNKNDAEALPYIQMFAIPLRSKLSPQPPTITSNGFSLHYTPDRDNLCQIMGKAIDTANDTAVVGAPASSNQGVYHGPGTNSLHGGGDIILMRTCNWPNLSSAFHHMSLTYISQASIEVTWTH